MRKRANYKKTQTRRTAVEVLFFALFIALISAGAVQLWLAVFAVSVLLGLRWARLYCGWVCPINTAFRPLRWVYAKLGVRRPMPGAWLQQEWLRYVALAAFVAAAVGQQLLGVTLPILAAVTVVAVLLTLVFDEQWWHATLCPFGTVPPVLPAQAGKRPSPGRQTYDGRERIQRAVGVLYYALGQ